MLDIHVKSYVQSQAPHGRMISITKRPDLHILIKHVYPLMCSLRLLTYAGSTAKLGDLFRFIPPPMYPFYSLRKFRKL